MKSLTPCVLVLAVFVLSSHASFIATALDDSSVTWRYQKVYGYHVDMQASGLFYETTLEAVVGLNRGYQYPSQCAYPPTRPFEMAWTFSLPEEFVVTGASLYDEASSAFRPCSLLDVTSGLKQFSIDSISRPGMLLRAYRQRSPNGVTSNLYRLTISPVQGVDQRVRLRVTMLAPCTMRWKARDLVMAGMVLYESSGCSSDLPSAGLSVRDHDNPSIPPYVFHRDSSSHAWRLSQGSWLMVASRHDVVDNGSVLRIGSEYAGTPYLHTQSIADGRIAYGFSVLPHIPGDALPSRRIVLAVDLREGMGIERNEAFQAVTAPLVAATHSSDSIVGLVSSFAPRWVDTGFVACSEQAIDRILDSARQIVPKLPNLPFMLREAVGFLNRNGGDGEIWLVSNDAEHGSPADRVMELLRQTYFSATGTVVFRIVDASGYSYGSRITVGGVNYDGNGYLYENLARLSGGSFTRLYGKPWYHWQDMVVDDLSPTVTAVEIDLQPTGGLTHSRYDLNNGRASYSNQTRYYQIGIAEGQAPFNVAYHGYFDGALYSQSIAASPVNPPALDSAAAQYWYASHIRDLLEQPQTAERIASIEQESLNGRVLSPYAGFVIPSSSGYIGFRKLVGADFAESEATAPPVVPAVTQPAAEIRAQVCSGVMLVDVTWPGVSARSSRSIALMDMQGRLVKSLIDDRHLGGNRTQVRVPISELGLSTGMYIVRASAGAGSFSARLVVGGSQGGM